MIVLAALTVLVTLGIFVATLRLEAGHGHEHGHGLARFARWHGIRARRPNR